MKDKMKKISSKINLKYLFVIIPLILIILLIISSSIFAEQNEKKEESKKNEIKTNTYTTKDNKVDFTFKEGHKLISDETHDLYVKDEKRLLATAIFTYNLENYEEENSKQILDNQVAYFLKTRNDMKLFKKETVKTYEDKVITRIEYSGKTEKSSDCIYIFSVIDFVNVPNYVVYVSQVLIKEDYEKYINELNKIVISAKVK